MRYSVVIPAFNAAGTLAEAVGSILVQDPGPVQIVVVDDGSTDGTAALARRLDPRIAVIVQGNAGVGRATTVGIAAVDTPFVAFIDADDVWLAGKIARQAARLNNDAQLGGVLAHARIFRDEASERRFGPVQPIWGRTTLLARSAAVRAIGPIVDPPGGRGDMVDWIARGRDGGIRFAMLPEVLALRRIRPDSMSFGRDAMRDRGYLTAARQALLRRRRAEQPDDGA